VTDIFYANCFGEDLFSGASKIEASALLAPLGPHVGWGECSLWFVTSWEGLQQQPGTWNTEPASASIEAGRGHWAVD